jgi:small-conductance mechanosensitive channel
MRAALRHWIAAALLTALALALAVPATAQSFFAPDVTATTNGQAAPDYVAWNRIATRAEALIGDTRTTNLALEQVRAQIAEWRTRFLEAQRANQTRITPLRDQIAALGDPPAEGETEEREIATRRAELNAELSRLRAPGIAADEAHRRADGLIREIDRILRERQADALLRLSPAPVNPANWPAGLTALSSTAGSLWSEVRNAWDRPGSRDQLRTNLPTILVLTVLGGLLIARGRRWVERRAQRLQETATVRGRKVLGFAASLGQVVLPLAGIYALAEALRSTGMVGLQGDVLVSSLPQVGFAIYSARWLATRIFPKGDGRDAPLALSAQRRREGRFHGSALGVLLGLEIALRASVVPVENTEAASAVIAFPILVLAGILLFRIGQLLRLHVTSDLQPGEQAGFRNRILGGIGGIAMLIGVVAPALAAVGYVTAAIAALYPAVLSLGLIALLIVVQRLVGDLYAALTQQGEDGEDGLVPVLVGFTLVLAALPVFALVWGARTADLWEIWARFRAGFTFGETRISPTDFLTFAIVFGVGYMLTKLVQGALQSTVLPKTRIEPGGQKSIVSGVGYLGLFLAALVAITATGIDLSSLAIVAGALSVGIGFGLQNVVSNFISGIILLVERPVAEGDWIEVGGVMGTVRAISVRSTTIETFDRTDVIVPNSDLISGMVTNYTRFNLSGRIIVPVGVAYGTDTRLVEKILHEVAEAQPLVVLNPPPSVLFRDFGDDALQFEIRAILRDVNFSLAVRSDMLHEITRRFREAGIEIPFAQRDIWLRNPEVLTGKAAPAASAPADPPAGPSTSASGAAAGAATGAALVGTATSAAAARAHMTADDMPGGTKDPGHSGTESSEDD